MQSLDSAELMLHRDEDRGQAVGERLHLIDEGGNDGQAQADEGGYEHEQGQRGSEQPRQTQALRAVGRRGQGERHDHSDGGTEEQRGELLGQQAGHDEARSEADDAVAVRRFHYGLTTVSVRGLLEGNPSQQ